MHWILQVHAIRCLRFEIRCVCLPSSPSLQRTEFDFQHFIPSQRTAPLCLSLLVHHPGSENYVYYTVRTRGVTIYQILFIMHGTQLLYVLVHLSHFLHPHHTDALGSDPFTLFRLVSIALTRLWNRFASKHPRDHTSTVR